MASLNFSLAPAAGKSINLTALGTADWLACPTTTYIRKNGGGSLIGLTHVGNTFGDSIATDSNATATWTDGSGTVSNSADTSLVFSTTGAGQGFQATFPADTNVRTAYLLMGGYGASQTVTATLSDGSAAAQTGTIVWSSGAGVQSLVKIDYSASTACTLTVKIVQASAGTSSNTSFQAAALSAPITVGGRNLAMTSPTYNASAKYGQSLNGGYGIASALPNSRRLSMTAVVKTTASGNTMVAAGQGNVFWMGMDANGYPVAHYGGGSGSTDVPLTPTSLKINDNASHLLDLCVDIDSGGYFFVDGALVASSTAASAFDFLDSANRFGVGVFPYGPSTAPNTGFPWVGEIDEVAVYAGVRHTAAYGAPTTATSTTDPNLISLYNLNGNGNDTAGTVAATAPNAPTITSVTPTTNGVIVAFTASGTGTAATSFTAVWSGGGSATGTTSPITITGLAATAGTVHMYASAGGLNSANTAESGSVTPTAGSSNVTIPFSDARIYYSPYTWDTYASYKSSNNAGAYFKFGFTGTSVQLNFDVSAMVAANLPAASYPIVRMVLDDTNVIDYPLTSSGGVKLSSIAAGSHSFHVHFLATDDNTGDIWVTPVQALRLLSVVLDNGASISAPASTRSKLHLHYGDSISRGYMAAGTNNVQPASNNSMLTVPPALAQMFDAEYGQVAYSGQGYEVSGNGGVVPVLSAWNLYSAGRSRLATGGLLSPQPDYITIEHGTNGASSVTAADVKSFLVALRAAAPNAKIIQMVPRGGFARTAVTAGFASFGDTNSYIVDIGTSYQTGISNYTGTSNMYSVDGLHPNPLANMRCAAAFAGKIQAALNASTGGTTTPTPTLYSRTVTLTLATGTDTSGNPILATNLAGIKISAYDEATPDLRNAPRYKSSTQTTNASGVLSFTMQSALASGATCGVSVQLASGLNFDVQATVV